MARLIQPYLSAVSASKSSPPSTISIARERPTSSGRRSVAPPPGIRPNPTSGWPKMALSRLANRTSQPSANSLPPPRALPRITAILRARSEEHTCELQSQSNLVCRLLLEKKKNKGEVNAPFNPLYPLHLDNNHTAYT